MGGPNNRGGGKNLENLISVGSNKGGLENQYLRIRYKFILLIQTPDLVLLILFENILMAHSN